MISSLDVLNLNALFNGAKLFISGLVVDNLHICGILLNAVFDSPARCLFQNMVQFNGFCGCPYCYAPGKSVQTSERGHTLTYPFNYENPNGHHELRTHLSNTRDGEEAEQKKANGVGNIRGVKGLGFFNYLPNFDIVRGVSVDYMHCVLLGVMKMRMTLWLTTRHIKMNISAFQQRQKKWMNVYSTSNLQNSSPVFLGL